MDPIENESDTEAFDEAFPDDAQIETTVIEDKTSQKSKMQSSSDCPKENDSKPDAYVPLILESDSELTVVTIGKETPNQAFFISPSLLDSKLVFIRENALPSQGVSLPSHFKFMTSATNNVIPLSMETRLTLKKLIAVNRNEKTINEELNGENDIFTSPQKLFICSMRSKKKKRKVERNEPQTDNEDIGSDGTNEGEIENMISTAAINEELPAPLANRCPMHSLNRILFNIQDGSSPLQGPCPVQRLNWRVLFKALIGLQCALISLVLLFIMSYYCLTCMTGMPMFPGFSYGTDMDDITKIRMKLSELEAAHRYSAHEIQTKVQEIHNEATRSVKHLSMKLAAFENKLDEMDKSEYPRPQESSRESQPGRNNRKTEPLVNKGEAAPKKN